jgi:hypothetical protein
LLGAQQVDAAAMQPCHGSGDQSGSSSDSTHGSCQYVSPTPDSGTSVIAAADLPAITIRFDVVAAQKPLKSVEPTLLRIEPPPHSLLHCCLRN